MADKTIAQQVIEGVAEHCGIPASDIKLESRFNEDLGADSLDQVELIIDLECKFDVNVSDEQAEKVQTVGDAVKLAEELNAARNK